MSGGIAPPSPAQPLMQRPVKRQRQTTRRLSSAAPQCPMTAGSWGIQATSPGAGSSGRGVGIPGGTCPVRKRIQPGAEPIYGSMQGSLLGGQHLAGPTPHFGSWASYTSGNSLLGSSALLAEATAAGLLPGQRYHHQHQQQAESFTSTLYADHS